MMLDTNIFCGFVWSPILSYHQEILEKINQNYLVKCYDVYDFDNNRDSYHKFVLDMYSTDDIDPKKVKNVKLKFLDQYEYKFAYFIFEIKNPKYRTKSRSCTAISTVIESLKKNIRSEYKVKIKNYVHDVCIHMCDNNDQCQLIGDIMKNYYEYRIHEFMNLKVFLRYQYDKNLFTRCDMLVRKYTIEQYLNDSDYDFDLYRKTQKIRLGLSNKKNINDRVENFKLLIDSLNKYNYNYNYPILYENNYMLANGSHRLAYVFFKKYVFIPIKLRTIYFKKKKKNHFLFE